MRSAANCQETTIKSALNLRKNRVNIPSLSACNVVMAISRIKPNGRPVIQGRQSRNPRGKNGTLHIRASPLARRGSLPYTTNPNTCQQGLPAEKSPATETETVVYVMRRDEGVPPYRRLRRESDTMSFRALAKKFPCGKNGTLHIRARPLANAGSAPKNPPHKKRHKTYPCQPTRPQWLPAAPAHLPAVAHRRKIPCGRNGT